MIDTETEPTSPRGRSAQQRQRRLLRKRIITAAVVGLLVVLAALWFSDTLRIPTDGPSFAGGVESETPETPTPTSPTEPTRRPLNPLLPLKLWIGGDSLAGALGPSLGRMTADTGVVQPQYDSRVGTGLLGGDLDWPEHAQEQMALLDPEVAVFIIGTNDAIVYDESQAAEYARLTEEMMRILVGDGREVYWVNAPVMRDEDLEENVLKIDEIQRAVAAKIPEVTFIDAHTLFADEAGEYQSSLPDETGDDVSMRAGDGIHLSGEGADHLAREIFSVLDQRWRILAQAVPGQAKEVIVTEGSTQVPGYDSDSGSSDSGDSDDWWSSDETSSGSDSGATTTTLAPPPPPPTTTQPPATSTTTTAATTPGSSP